MYETRLIFVTYHVSSMLSFVDERQQEPVRTPWNRIWMKTLRQEVGMPPQLRPHLYLNLLIRMPHLGQAPGRLHKNVQRKKHMKWSLPITTSTS